MSSSVYSGERDSVINSSVKERPWLCQRQWVDPWAWGRPSSWGAVDSSLTWVSPAQLGCRVLSGFGQGPPDWLSLSTCPEPLLLSFPSWYWGDHTLPWFYHLRTPFLSIFRNIQHHQWLPTSSHSTLQARHSAVPSAPSWTSHNLWKV